MSRASKLAYQRETERVARRLGLPAYGPGVDAAIVDYCRDEVDRLIGSSGLPGTMDGLLTQVATCLDVEFFEVHTDDDLGRLRRDFCPEDEPAIVRVLQELGGDVDAITIRRKSPKEWDRLYLSVINCRGRHFYRRYFTKWHELAHRLIDGEQLTLAFRQTTIERPDPEEVLVDKVAAELAFLPDIVGPPAIRLLGQFGLSFQAVDALRNAVAPEASRQAAALALMRQVDRPAWYLRCTETLKPSEVRTMSDSGVSVGGLEAKLRVVEASPNQAARDSATRIHQWMRVPESGIIARSWEFMQDLAGEEPLDHWETSSGGPIGTGGLHVDTLVGADLDHILALVALEDG